MASIFFFLVIKLKALYEFSLFIKHSSVNSLALCSGHRNSGLTSESCWLAHSVCFTAAVFWGLCLQLAELKPKTFQTAHILYTLPISQPASLALENVYSENMTNVLETPDSNKTE